MTLFVNKQEEICNTLGCYYYSEEVDDNPMRFITVQEQSTLLSDWPTSYCQSPHPELPSN